jgi:RHS repeat-associated protein
MDGSSTIQDHLDYDGFGRVTESNTSYGDAFKFTAREYDYDTGLQYNRARYYDPMIGRWMSEDPLGFGAGDENLYRYVANNPVGAVDPTGLFDALVHAQMTERAVSAWAQASKVDEMDAAAIVEFVTGANVRLDKDQTPEVQYKHFCRPFNEATETNCLARSEQGKTVDKQYGDYLALEMKNATDPDVTSGDQLEAMGRLSHSWQDFYGHAVRLDQGGRTLPNPAPGYRAGQPGSENSRWPGFSAFNEGLKGDPLNHPKFIPCSYVRIWGAGPQGEHPPFAEPLTNGGGEYNTRYNLADRYTDNLDVYLGIWYVNITRFRATNGNPDIPLITYYPCRPSGEL